MTCARRLSLPSSTGWNGRGAGYPRPDLETLDLYCAVLLPQSQMSVHVFGDASDARPHRSPMRWDGALQLTNILRDLAETRSAAAYLPP